MCVGQLVTLGVLDSSEKAVLGFSALDSAACTEILQMLPTQITSIIAAELKRTLHIESIESKFWY